MIFSLAKLYPKALGHPSSSLQSMPSSRRGVSINRGTPLAGWFISWKIREKWLIWGYPYFRKPPFGDSQRCEQQHVRAAAPSRIMVTLVHGHASARKSHQVAKNHITSTQTHGHAS